MEIQEKKGCVYFFKHVGIDAVKIGYSSDLTPFNRFEQFKTYAPNGAVILGFFECYLPNLIESELHKKYSKKRLNGEWFNISTEEVISIIENYTKESLNIVLDLHFAKFNVKKQPKEEATKQSIYFNVDKKDRKEYVIAVYKTNPNFNRTLLAVDLGIARKTIHRYIKEHKDSLKSN